MVLSATKPLAAQWTRIGHGKQKPAFWPTPGMSAAFIFLMVILKIPIALLLYIVWYAIKSPPQPEPVAGEDGGTKRPLSPRPRHPQHPRPALPRNPHRQSCA